MHSKDSGRLDLSDEGQSHIKWPRMALWSSRILLSCVSPFRSFGITPSSRVRVNAVTTNLLEVTHAHGTHTTRARPALLRTRHTLTSRSKNARARAFTIGAQIVNRRLRVDIAKRKAIVVLVHDIRRDFLCAARSDTAQRKQLGSGPGRLVLSHGGLACLLDYFVKYRRRRVVWEQRWRRCSGRPFFVHASRKPVDLVLSTSAPQPVRSDRGPGSERRCLHCHDFV